MKNKSLLPDKKILLIALLAVITGIVIGQQPFFHRRPEPDLQTVDTAPAFSAIRSNSQENYICPMHPEITSDAPGNCPICGMSLVPHRHDMGEHIQDGSYPAVNISPVIMHNLAVRLEPAIIGDMQHTIETIGKITRIDLTARRIITPPISGILTYIADKYSGDEVTGGELLFSISSPESLEQQRTFQERFTSGDSIAAAAMIPQLIKSGLSEQQISDLQAGRSDGFSIEVHAKEPGYIFSRRGETGDSIPSGFTVFNIGSNYRVVEVTAEIFERQWGWIAKGQQATMTVRGLPGISFSGTVVDVEPPVGYTTRSLEARLKFKTDHPGLSQSMFARVSIKGKIRHNLLMVPKQSVIRSGQGDRVVIYREDGLFQPVPVVAGEETDTMIEIISGLNEGDTVVSSGQFLIDSESNLQSAFHRMSVSRHHNAQE